MKVKITDTNPRNLGDYEDVGFVEGIFHDYRHFDYNIFGINILIKKCPEYVSTMEFGIALPFDYISIDFLKLIDKALNENNKDACLLIELDDMILKSYTYQHTIKKEIKNAK